jgi:tRNA-modifying protein YgfZ
MEQTNTDSFQISNLADPVDNSSNENIGMVGLNNISVLESEMNSLYTGVGMRDISSSGVIELKGNDVLDFLHRISTNSIKNIVKGEVAKTIFTTEKGRIIDTGVIINLDEYQLLICSQEHQEKMMIWLQKYIISDDVKLNKVNGKYTLLELIGPQADSFMTIISGNIVNNIQPNTIKIINTDGILFFLMKHFDQNGHLVYWILADPVYAQKLIRYMVENKGPFNFNLIGEEAYNYYRIENGIPIAPNEINDLHSPHEVGLMQQVSTTKGCYIGQEVIARLDTYDKVQKNLCGFLFSEAIQDEDKLLVFDESNGEAGNITSTTYSNRFKKHLGIGFVRRKYFEDGKELIAKNGSGNPLKVFVKKLPFKK